MIYAGCVQAYHQMLPSLYAHALGYADLAGQSIFGPTAPSSTVPISDAVRGLSLLLPTLQQAANTATYDVGSEQHRRRGVTATQWQEWAAQFPLSVRPTLAHCQPVEVLAFLQHWANTHTGRPKRSLVGGPADLLPPVAASTLSKVSTNLSAIMTNLGRVGSWSPTNPNGNPCDHPMITQYLNGYKSYLFQDKKLSVSGAVPMSLSKLKRLTEYLLREAQASTGPQKLLLYRDLCVIAYAWETGQRGKECGQVLVFDFKYQDLRCTSAWPDISEGKTTGHAPVLVELSLGTKVVKDVNSGVFKLTEGITDDGAGLFLHYLPSFVQAMRAHHAPILQYVFRPQDRCEYVYKEAPLTNDAMNKRLQQHLVKMGEWEGESVHGIRRGRSQHLFYVLGMSKAAIAELLHWSSEDSVDLYLHPLRHGDRLIQQELSEES